MFVAKEMVPGSPDVVFGGASRTGDGAEGEEGEEFVAWPVPSFLPPHPATSKKPITSKAVAEVNVWYFTMCPS